MYSVDPFSPGRSGNGLSRFVSAVLATAVIRCWPLLLFFSAWATAVSLISHNVYNLAIQPTLLTVEVSLSSDCVPNPRRTTNPFGSDSISIITQSDA